jgi:hypothetical protein
MALLDSYSPELLFNLTPSKSRRNAFVPECRPLCLAHHPCRTMATQRAGFDARRHNSAVIEAFEITAQRTAAKVLIGDSAVYTQGV